jgi:FtsP/CotA-like multicopper oxidase with cupredoxin domain
MPNKKLLLALLIPIAALAAVFLINPVVQSEQISFDSSALAQVTESETVLLQDGDFYELSAEMITKEIEGQTLTMMGYNGSIPGPTIQVTQGSTVTIKFTNNTPIENTVHSHGIRLKNEFDGVPGVTQEAVQPGESFTYEIVFPDAGVYWYHPHVREDLTQEMGLYGAFIVEPSDDSYWNEVDQEETIFLDDYLLTSEGLAPFYEESFTHTLMGRYGNEYLINGEEEYELTVQQNEIVRFSFLNVANVRPFNVSLEEMDWKLVGSDAGAYENETMVESVIIGPSERYIVEAYFNEPGVYELQHKTPDDIYTLGTITVLEDEALSEETKLTAFNTLKTSTAIRDEIPDFENFLTKEVDKKLRLDLDMDMGLMTMMGDDSSMPHGESSNGMSGMPCHEMPDGTMMGDCDLEEDEHEGGIEWEDEMAMMNAMSTHMNVEWQLIDEETGDINDEIDWSFDVGEYVLIEIDNDEDSMHPMQHPIHFHGQRFVILEQDESVNDNLVWKDTVLIPTGESVKLLLEVTNPGEWMAHCHIAEHMHSGMMFDFGVE